jgi:hypothetical protein
MKKIFLILSILCINFISNAQWTTTQGICYSMSNKTYEYANILQPGFGGTPSFLAQRATKAIGINALFMPSYHFVGQEEFTDASAREVATPYNFSFGLPICLGVNGFNSSRAATGISFFYSFATTADINFGSYKYKNNTGAGAFFGLGLGIANTNTLTADYFTEVQGAATNANYATFNNLAEAEQDVLGRYKRRAMSYGPLLHAGFQFEMPWRKGRKNGLYLSYQIGVAGSPKKYLSVAYTTNGVGTYGRYY